MPNATLDLVVAKLDEVHQEQKSQRGELAELKQAITQLQVRDEERWPMQQHRVSQVESLLREVERGDYAGVFLIDADVYWKADAAASFFSRWRCAFS